jgi:hypothetical protein
MAVITSTLSVMVAPACVKATAVRVRWECKKQQEQKVNNAPNE